MGEPGFRPPRIKDWTESLMRSGFGRGMVLVSFPRQSCVGLSQEKILNNQSQDWSSEHKREMAAVAGGGRGESKEKRRGREREGVALPDIYQLILAFWISVAYAERDRASLDTGANTCDRRAHTKP